MNAVDLFRYNIPETCQRLLPESVARANGVIVLDFESDTYTIAMSDPSNFDLTEKLRFILNAKIVPVLATPTGIEYAINRYYGTL